MRSLIRAFANRKYSMSVKLLTEHHLEFLSLKGGCTGWSDSTHIKMPHCWKSHVTAHVSLHQMGWRLSCHLLQLCKYLVSKEEVHEIKIRDM